MDLSSSARISSRRLRAAAACIGYPPPTRTGPGSADGHPCCQAGSALAQNSLSGALPEIPWDAVLRDLPERADDASKPASGPGTPGSTPSISSGPLFRTELTAVATGDDVGPLQGAGASDAIRSARWLAP